MARFGDNWVPKRWDTASLSLSIGSLFGVRIRLHLLFLIIALYFVARGIGEQNVAFIIWFLLLWGSILLHEFGHVFTCRAVGGIADEILLWPLGGLAYCSPPPRALENFLTTAGGPAVNLVICVILAPVLAWNGALGASLFYPFTLFVPQELTVFSVAEMFFQVNYFLFVFNMSLPIFPFDLGRIIRDLLWMKMTHNQATLIACNIGMGAGLLVAGLALGWQQFMLVGLALFGVAESYRTKQELELNDGGIESDLGYDFSEGYTSLERSSAHAERRPNLSLRERFRQWWSRRRRRHEAQLDADLDRILEKISHNGMESLSWSERRTLQAASRRRKKQIGS